MGFSFQSLGQLGLLQSLLGAGPAVAGPGATFPSDTQDGGPFSALLQQALSTVDSTAFTGSGSLSGAPTTFSGVVDAAPQPSPILFQGVSADQDLVAAPYGFDEAYDPLGVPTDVLNAAIAETPSAFNAKIATALRTQTIKAQSPAPAQPTVQLALPESTNPIVAEDVPPAAPLDPLNEAAGPSTDAADVSSDGDEAEQDAIAETLVDPASPTVLLTVPTPPLAADPASPTAFLAVPPPLVAVAPPVEDAGGGADTIAALGSATAQAAPLAAPSGQQVAEQALEAGDTAKTQAAVQTGKRETAEKTTEAEFKTDPSSKDTQRSSVADAGPERKSSATQPQEQSGSPAKPEVAPAPPPASHRPPDVAPASGTPAGQPVAQSAPVQPAPPADRPALERAHPAPAADQIGTAVARASKDGRTEIHVRLDPVELGRVEVRLHFQADGEVRAQVTTDNPQTFDLLRRDSQSLERALQDAGIKTDSGSLSFNLRQQDHQAGQQELAKNHRGGNDSGASGRSDSPAVAALEASTRGRKPTSLFDVLA